ncbi:MAG: hypothetical protein EHM36_05855 [Deltaproteobacteria bacterium]|nr:MAG: hypothetical protein EHM36_05855 [Deltaproteobacteria bacterium]
MRMLGKGNGPFVIWSHEHVTAGWFPLWAFTAYWKDECDGRTWIWPRFARIRYGQPKVVRWGRRKSLTHDDVKKGRREPDFDDAPY